MEPDDDLEELRAIRERFKSAPPKDKTPVELTDLEQLQKRMAQIEARLTALEADLSPIIDQRNMGQRLFLILMALSSPVLLCALLESCSG
ncbi:MAG TPA: hypothetical protein VHP83_01900 [Aggregatilineaceae bacterium]|nr:hypothetical protein [Aggregatilineaceae bacterium]